MISFTTVSEARASYEQWLPSQPLSNHTRRTYLTQVNRYCSYLSTLHWEYGHPLQEPHARDYAVRDYKTALKVVHHAKPSSVNLGLAAVDHFYRFLELPTAQALYTLLGGSWLNMSESIQRILKRRALDGEHPTTPQQIIDWLEETAEGWNADPTPFVWGGKRKRRRDRARDRRHALGGSGAYSRRPLRRQRTRTKQRPGA